MPEPLATLVNHLRSDSREIRLEAAEQIAQLGPAAHSAAVPLVEAMATEDDEFRELVSSALEDLGPPATDAVSRLAALAESAPLDVAYWAVTLLGRLAEGAASAAPALALALRAHPEMAVRERAAWALGEIGPAASAAAAELEAAARGDAPRLKRLAEESLARVKP